MTPTDDRRCGAGTLVRLIPVTRTAMRTLGRVPRNGLELSRQQHSAARSPPARFVDAWTHTSTGIPVRDVESFSSFERSTEIEKLESVQVSQMEKERILAEQKSLHEFLGMKADRAFQGEFALRQKNLKRRLN